MYWRNNTDLKIDTKEFIRIGFVKHALHSVFKKTKKHDVASVLKYLL